MSCHHQNNSVKNIRTAFFLNLSFTLIELIGGWLTNSVAILSDAIHDLGDSFSLGTSWFFESISQKKRTDTFTFGYRRFSLLGSIISAFVIFTGSIVILTVSIPRLFHPESPHAKGMFALSIVGILINGAAVLRLKQGKTLHERAISWHLMEDVLGWAAICITSAVLFFKDLPILDPILSVLITLWVLYHVMKNMKKSFFVFLQSAPEDISVTEVEKKILNIAYVKGVHHTHIWSLDGEHNILSIHLVVEPKIKKQDFSTIKKDVRRIGHSMGIEHTTVEIEFGHGDCSISGQREYCA